MNDWVDIIPDYDSPYYPFYKVRLANTFAGAEQLPYQLIKYILDEPDGNGYVPKDNNALPRCRLKKLIYYDGLLPLDNPMPTVEQMRSITFDPRNPSDEKARIFNQEFRSQAQANAQTTLHCYLASANPKAGKTESFRQQVIFKVLTNYAQETNTGMTAASRSYDIAQAIIEAVNGVNFTGIGGMELEMVTKIDDERQNLGYKIYFLTEILSPNANTNF